MNDNIPQQIFARIKKRAPGAHKGDFGHVLVLAGSQCYTGAPYLVSQGALRSGSGLVTLGVGKSLHAIMASKLIEVMVRPFYETKDLSLGVLAERDIIKFSEKTDVIAVGPGMSLNKETQQLIRSVLAKINRPFVVDADALTALVNYTDILKKTAVPAVITPHPGEMGRLTQKDTPQIQQNRKAIAENFAKSNRCIVVLKGERTVVASPDGESYINSTGNPGMATGGVGDVLTGIIASFIGQGLDAYTASVLGVYIHGLAGDLAAKETGQYCLTATDLLRFLKAAFKELQ